MDGLIWTIVVWGAMFVAASRLKHRYPVLTDWFSREFVALALALLGTYSIAARSDADTVLRQPLVLERILRGGLAMAALLVVAPLVLERMRSYRPGLRALGGLTFYLAVATISTLYSAAPLVTFAKVVELTAGFVPLVVIAIGPRPGERLRAALGMVMALVAGLTAIAVVGFFVMGGTFASFQSRPGFISAKTMISPYAHSNSLAAHGALIAVFCLALTLRGGEHRRFWAAGTALGAVAVVLASGRQGVAMALAGTAVVLWAMRRALFLVVLGPATGTAIYAYRDTLFTALARNRPQNFTNFTGRLYWWEAAVEAWSSHPWTGWGYAAGGRFVALASIGKGRTSSVHSGYVEALVGVGLIGMAGLVYAIWRVCVWSLHNLKTETHFAVLIVPLVLRTAVSQGFGGWLNVEFVLFAALAAIADNARVEQRSRSLAHLGS